MVARRKTTVVSGDKKLGQLLLYLSVTCICTFDIFRSRTAQGELQASHSNPLVILSDSICTLADLLSIVMTRRVRVTDGAVGGATVEIWPILVT